MAPTDALLQQQLLLFAVAAALPLVALLVTLFAGTTAPWVFAATTLPLPVAVGFAVLAHGLYDLRTAANRTLVWLTLSAAVVDVYALVIAGVGSFPIANAAPWLPWLAAAVVAISFAPLRDGLQRAVNRVTFGRWDEPYDVLANLGQRLEDTADVDGLLTEVLRELRDGFGLKDVAIHDTTGLPLAGESASPSEVVRHPLSAYGKPVGLLSYATPTTPLRDRDQRLLDDLAGHLGGLLHARELTTDLQFARERLVLAREEERRRLRRDLHDGLGPALGGHVLRLDVIAGKLASNSAVRADVDALRRDLQDTIADFRKVVEGLRPPALDDLGLAGAIAQVTSRLTTATGGEIELHVEDLPPLPAAAEVAAFGIACEAMTNAVRHAEADRIQVRIGSVDRLLRVVVADDGRGISTDGTANRRGNGLETMRERAEELRGRLRVSNAAGTTVTAELPLSARERPTEGRRPRAGYDHSRPRRGRPPRLPRRLDCAAELPSGHSRRSRGRGRRGRG
jgi:signal transduction histidine kinase